VVWARVAEIEIAATKAKRVSEDMAPRMIVA